MRIKILIPGATRQGVTHKSLGLHEDQRSKLKRAIMHEFLCLFESWF